MKKSQKLNSKSIKHQLRQSEGYSQQQHQPQYRHKDILMLFSIQKVVFINLRQKKQQLIRSFMLGQKTNQTSSKRIIKKNHFVFYLQKIQQSSFYIQPQTFSDALTDFKGLLLDQITKIWDKLSQQQRGKYEQIGMKNGRMMEQFEGEQNLNKYSGFWMLKINILSIFFLYNNRFVKAFKNTRRKLFSVSLLGRVLDLDLSYVAKMSNKFKQQQNNIRIDYRQELHEYVELLALMKLAYKLNNYVNTTKYSFQSIPLVDVQLEVNIADETYVSNTSQFSFCQIAYKPIEKMLRIKNSARFTLQASVQTMNYQRQKLLLQVAKEYKISYHILLEINSKMDKNEQISKEQFVAHFESNLSKCQWIFLKGESSILQGINTAFGSEFTDSNIYSGDGRIGSSSFLTKLAFERFALLSTVFSIQVKLEQKLTVYAYKFQYSLSDLWSSKRNGQVNGDFQQCKDLKCSLIILVANSEIVAYAFCRNVLTPNKYLCLVKLCSKLIQKKYTKQFNLVIYEFDAQHTIHTEVFTLFQIYMDRHYGARVYVLNDPLFFQPHFLVDSFLRSFLPKLNLNKQNFYWYFEVCTNKLLKGIQVFDKTTNEEQFAYFAKIMSLQVGVRDVWKCFKKDRGNRYNAVVLGRGDTEEESPSKYHLLIDEEVPSQQWFRSIELCQPSLKDFVRIQERENWRTIEQYTEDYSKDFEGFLQRKHFKENPIRRILKDVARFLIDYQLYFRQLVNGQRNIKQGSETSKIVEWLRDFYDKQNENIEKVYSRAEREAIFEEFTKKYQKVQKAHLQKMEMK